MSTKSQFHTLCAPQRTTYIMTEDQPANKTISLKKTLGLSGIFVAAIGGAVSQSTVVAVLDAAGKGGGPFFVAFFIALIITFCYVVSYSELAVMMPRAGGISTYTAVAMGHFPAIIAALVGSLTPLVFGGPAELTLVDRMFNFVYPGVIAHPGLILLTLFVVLNMFGINIFARTQNILAYAMLVAMTVIGIDGLNFSGAKGIPTNVLINDMKHVHLDIFSLVLLSLWSLIGFETVCTLAEETKNPRRDLPRGIFMAAIVLFMAYVIFASATVRVIPATEVTNADLPHLLIANVLFGKAGRMVFVILGIVISSVGINGTTAAAARLLFGMAHHKQLPAIFKKVHPRWRTPWFSLIMVFIFTAIPTIVFGHMRNVVFVMVISASAVWLINYIIAHINVIILRYQYPKFKRPFRTRFYPLPQLIGIAGMVYAFIHNAPSADMTKTVYINTASVIAIAAIYAFFRVKYVMKTKLFKAEPIQMALRD